MKTTKPKWMRLDWRGARPLTLRELIAKSSFLPMMDHIIDFQQQVPHEFEDCEPYRHDLIMQTNGGGLLRIKPKH